MNDIETIKNIRANWPKNLDHEYKPPIDGIITSDELTMPVDDFTIRNITIMEPNGKKWDIVMRAGVAIECRITIPSPSILEDFLNKESVDLSHLAQWGPSPRALELLDKLSPEPEPEEPKKVIHRRIILD